MLKLQGNELKELLSGLSEYENAKQNLSAAQNEVRSILFHLARSLKQDEFVMLCRYLKLPSSLTFQLINSIDREHIWDAEQTIKAIRAE